MTDLSGVAVIAAWLGPLVHLVSSIRRQPGLPTGLMVSIWGCRPRQAGVPRAFDGVPPHLPCRAMTCLGLTQCPVDWCLRGPDLYRVAPPPTIGMRGAKQGAGARGPRSRWDGWAHWRSSRDAWMRLGKYCVPTGPSCDVELRAHRFRPCDVSYRGRGRPIMPASTILGPRP